ncbi:MAG: beta-propeller domain-containing protein [Polyangiaceae bacterium]|nr:beta-propeller domain-containing protein [Polyangiaceae bacterium]
MRVLRLGLFLTSTCFVAASCAPGGVPRAAKAPAPSAAPARSPLVMATDPAPAPLPPPPKITTPMAGEPAAATLAEARLASASCEDLDAVERTLADARVRQMRQTLADSLKGWVDAQPGCWEQYRWEAEARKNMRLGRISGYGSGYGYGMGHGSLGLSGVGSGGGGVGMGSASARAAKSASGTNNQVKGVDEADIVKTDGRFVYFAVNGSLRIVEALKPRVVSSTPLGGVAKEMFVQGDRAVVYTSDRATRKRCTYGYDCQFAGDGSSTQILVFDIADRARPRKLRQIDLSGSLIAARRIDRAVHTVVADGDSPDPSFPTWPAGLETCGSRESVVRAKFAQLARDNEKLIRSSRAALPKISEGGKTQSLCGNVMKTALSDGRAFTTLVSFDLGDDAAAPSTATVQTRPGAVFASAGALYLSVTSRRAGRSGRWYSFLPGVDEVSQIHKFAIGERPGATRYVGSGVVPGHVLSQFSMDEWHGYLRVATTRGKVPDPKVESVVSVLAEAEGGNLVRVGAVSKIAPGEDIRAVRFDDERGYVVTFKKTDPLFVLDLYDPAAPKILGELKIPGFSTYIHRIDRNHLLSIGFDADDHGSFAYFDGILLQLFDVKNPTEPKLLHKEKIGTRGSSSEAATDQLAFNYFHDRKLLAVPTTLCEGGGDGRQGSLAFSGLLVYDVSTKTGFKKLGGVDHGTHGASCSAWWSNAASAVKRSVFLDDLVYSVAMDRVKVQRMSRFGEDLADISFAK